LTFEIWQNYPAPVGFWQSRISAGFGKSAVFQLEPKSGTVLVLMYGACFICLVIQWGQ